MEKILFIWVSHIFQDPLLYLIHNQINLNGSRVFLLKQNEGYRHCADFSGKNLINRLQVISHLPIVGNLLFVIQEGTKKKLTHEPYCTKTQLIQRTRSSSDIQEISWSDALQKYNCIAHIRLHHTLWQTGLVAAKLCIIRCCSVPGTDANHANQPNQQQSYEAKSLGGTHALLQKLLCKTLLNFTCQAHRDSI